MTLFLKTKSLDGQSMNVFVETISSKIESL